MSKVLKICFMFAAISFIVGSVAMAADQDRKRDRKRDGSCDTEVTAADRVPVLAADQDRKRDRKRDGSCDTDAVPADMRPTPAIA